MKLGTILRVSCFVVAAGIIAGPPRTSTAEVLRIAFTDPIGDFSGANSPFDITLMVMDFNNTFGSYAVTFYATTEHPFSGSFTVNANILNVDANPTTLGYSGFFSSGPFQFNLPAPSTSVRISGLNTRLAGWNARDRVAATSGRFGPPPGFPPGFGQFASGASGTLGRLDSVATTYSGSLFAGMPNSLLGDSMARVERLSTPSPTNRLIARIPGNLQYMRYIGFTSENLFRQVTFLDIPRRPVFAAPHDPAIAFGSAIPEYELAIDTEIIQESTDGFAIFGADEFGNLFVSSPAQGEGQLLPFASLFPGWSPQDVLADPSAFFTDAGVWRVLARPFINIGDAPLELQFIRYNGSSDVGAVIGSGQTAAVPEPSATILGLFSICCWWRAAVLRRRNTSAVLGEHRDQRVSGIRAIEKGGVRCCGGF